VLVTFAFIQRASKSEKEVAYSRTLTSESKEPERAAKSGQHPSIRFIHPVLDPLVTDWDPVNRP
jgi:hypothetical protein